MLLYHTQTWTTVALIQHKVPFAADDEANVIHSPPSLVFMLH